MNTKAFFPFSFLFLSHYSQAAIISFEPTTQSAGLGESAIVNLFISDLGGDFVSAFDLSITYDSSILSFQNFNFGTGLDPFNLGTLNGVEEVGNSLNIFELSLDRDEDLTLLQPNAFVIGTLSFDAIAAGISNLSFSSVEVLGALEFDPNLGFEVPSSVLTSVQNGSVEVVRSSVEVSEPASIALLLAGMLGVGFSRKRAWRQTYGN